MKKFRRLILIFCLLLSIPLGYFIFRTHQAMAREERAELRYFADTLFSEMENELSGFVAREEGREIDAYTRASDLSKLPAENFILGYFQNNPDGSFQTPLAVEGGEADAGSVNERVTRLKGVNQVFNTRRTDVSARTDVRPPEKIAAPKEESFSFAEKYLDLSRSKKQKSVLGQESRRVAEITPQQALNLASRDQKSFMEDRLESQAPAAPRARKPQKEEAKSAEKETMGWDKAFSGSLSGAPAGNALPSTGITAHSRGFPDADTFRAEIDPLQSVFVSDNQMVLFRRIVIDNQVYRQGVVILLNEFAAHLVQTHFNGQPMARFTRLQLSIRDQGSDRPLIQAGAAANHLEFTLTRTFPRPFAFLTARIDCDRIPRSSGRQTLNIMIIGMGLVMLVGLFAIYRSAGAIADLSERRSRFVSSVTHELKTPLTNIRMYIEMLEQKIAPNPQREQEYFRILGTESTRLSRLIGNVLEFSRLEKKSRQLNLTEGTFDEVIGEVESIMGEKLRQEGFAFQVENRLKQPFSYDREAMVQVLVNLVENSIKFGKHQPVKNITLTLETLGNRTLIRLSDTGPGIPRRALKKVFDDFVRVDADTAKTAAGTGIGLALVRRFIRAMGGKVRAENNTGPGCTIVISLPAGRRTK